eukprot:2546010-Pleurochrysis_carterae.AAC.1
MAEVNTTLLSVQIGELFQAVPVSKYISSRDIMFVTRHPRKGAPTTLFHFGRCDQVGPLAHRALLNIVRS